MTQKSKADVKIKEYELLDGSKKKKIQKIKDGSIIIRFDKIPVPKKPTDIVCPHFLELKWAYGCPYGCAWCYLQGTLRFLPTKTQPKVKNYEKIMSHLKIFLNSQSDPEVLNTGELADSLMYENNGKPFSKFVIPIFEKQNKHKVLFLTKSNNVKNLLEIEKHEQVIVSFTLNAENVSAQWERSAPHVKLRIYAAKKVYDAGYETRIRIDPIVPFQQTKWETYYKRLIDDIFSNFEPERITLGSLRGLQSTINNCKDKSWVEYLSERSAWGKKIDSKIRYEAYSTLIRYLNKEYNYSKIALCKETVLMWNKLEMDYKKIRCNCIL